MDELLVDAPVRHSAHASEEAAWQAFEVDDDAGTIRRPRGFGFDPGGCGKGLAADMAAGLLAAYPRFLVSCGGDIRVGGPDAEKQPFEVFVEHPATGTRPHLFRIGRGGIATSGIGNRSWRRDDGSPTHHLLNPATGEPVWSGLIGATALAPTTLEAETLAKAALLSGPDGAREILSRYGGILVLDDGRVEAAGRSTFRVRVPAPEASGASA
jgi:thiamine biosynthesis lipoprotein